MRYIPDSISISDVDYNLLVVCWMNTRFLILPESVLHAYGITLMIKTLTELSICTVSFCVMTIVTAYTGWLYSEYIKHPLVMTSHDYATIYIYIVQCHLDHWSITAGLQDPEWQVLQVSLICCCCCSLWRWLSWQQFVIRSWVARRRGVHWKWTF